MRKWLVQDNKAILKFKPCSHLICNFIHAKSSLSFALESYTPILMPPSIKSDNYRVKAYIIKRKPYSHECYFLDEETLCKIHHVKPFACKIYPFSLRPNDDESVKILIHAESVCKFIFDAEEEESNTKTIVKEILEVIISNMKER